MPLVFFAPTLLTLCCFQLHLHWISSRYPGRQLWRFWSASAAVFGSVQVAFMTKLRILVTRRQFSTVAILNLTGGDFLNQCPGSDSHKNYLGSQSLTGDEGTLLQFSSSREFPYCPVSGSKIVEDRQLIPDRPIPDL